MRLLLLLVSAAVAPASPTITTIPIRMRMMISVVEAAAIVFLTLKGRENMTLRVLHKNGSDFTILHK